jgi:hypothetical protein
MKLLKLFSSDIMEFYCHADIFGSIPEPIPAYKAIPEWFKKVPAVCPVNARDTFGGKIMTAKKCMPMLDALSIGYIIPLFGDVNVRVCENGKFIEAGNNGLGSPIEFHDVQQLGGITSPTYPSPAVKFVNKWIIKTAPGYSTLFMPPLNSFESRFTCLSGVVDTDTFDREVNFPAVWHKFGCDEVLPAGTPLVVCIPIKRSDMKKFAAPRAMTNNEAKSAEKTRKKQISRRGVYTHELREKR